MTKITAMNELIESTPQEAAENIDNASVFKMNAGVFKENKKHLKPEVDKIFKPSEATEEVTRYMAQSTEHASLASPDIAELSTVEKRWGTIGGHYQHTIDTQELVDINLKSMFERHKFTEEEQLDKFLLSEKVNKFSSELSVPGQVVNAAFEMGNTVYKHAALIASGTALGAVAGAGPASVPGAFVGAGVSFMVGSTYDATQTQMALVFNELSDATDTQGRDLDHETKRNFSVGIGVTTGAITAAVGVAVAKGIPFLSKFIGPKAAAKLVSSPTAAALTKIGMNISKSAVAGGLGGATQAAVEIFGKEFAKSDKSEAGFLNALTAVGDQLEAIQNAATVGAVVTGGITTGASAVGYRGIRSGYKSRLEAAQERAFGAARDITPEAPKRVSDLTPRRKQGRDSNPVPDAPLDRAIEILAHDSQIDAIKKNLAATEMKKLSPAETFKLQAEMVRKAGLKAYYFDKEEMNKWADTAEKAEDLRAILTPENEANAAINATVTIDPAKALQLDEKYPGFSEIFKLTPEGPSVSQAVKFIAELDDAEKRRQEIKTALDVPDLTPEKRAEIEAGMKAALDTEQPSRVYPSNDVFGEEEYLNQPTFTEAIKSVLGDTEVDKFNISQLKARQNVVDGINETAKYEMDEVIDVGLEYALQAEYESQLLRTEGAGNPNLPLVDKMTAPEEVGQYKGRYLNFDEMRANHAKPGFSPYAIDPRSLPADLKQKFSKDPQLKKHKTFVQGGLPLEEAARLIGVNNGETLLKVLSTTPSREDIAAGRTAVRALEIEAELRANVPLNETAIINAYNDNTANHVAEMNYMKSKEWSSTKAGIRRIALPLPTIGELTTKARKIINKTKVGALNVNQFKVGERKSQRIAAHAIVKNQVQKAFVNKEAATLNIALAKETHLTTGKVNRGIRFAQKFNKKETMRVLSDAGKLYENAAIEILDVFHLNPTKKGLAERGAFQKLSKELLLTGEGIVDIPERLTDVRESMNEMMVEQFLAAVDALRTVYHLAKLKNKLYNKYKDKTEQNQLERISFDISEGAKNAINFNPKRNEILQPSSVVGTEKYRQMFDVLANSLNRTQNLLEQVDDDKPNGAADNYIWQPLKSADNDRSRLTRAVDKQLQDAINWFGKEDFEKMTTTMLDPIEEFKDAKGLRHDKISLMDLFVMFLNSGEPGGISSLENFGVSHATILSVAESRLTKKHGHLGQKFWNINKSLKHQIVELEKRTTGVEPRMVEGKPFMFKGEQLDGGYYRLHYVEDTVKVDIERAAGKAEIDKLERIKARYGAKAMTEQSHLEQRTGSNGFIDLDIKHFAHDLDQMIHDITHREAIRDLIKILAYEDVQQSIVAVVGKEGYSTIVNTVEAVANSALDNKGSRSDGSLLKVGTYLRGGFQTVVIAGKLSSIVIQPASLAIMINRIGIHGPKHFALVVGKFAADSDVWDDYFRFAAENHPDIYNVSEALEGDMVQNLLKSLQQKRNPLEIGRDFAKDNSFKALGLVDTANKVITFSTGYSAAINGDVDGIQPGNHAEAVRYASNLVELTQTSSNTRNLSDVQRNRYLNWALMFFNDSNILHNENVRLLRMTKKKAKEARDAHAKGQKAKAAKLAAVGVGIIMGTILMYTIINGWENISRGKDVLPDEDSEFGDIAESIASGAADVTIGRIPVAREILYASQKKWLKRKIVEDPYATVKGDLSTAAAGLYHALPFIEAEVSKQELRSMIFTLGYLTHVPVGGFDKLLGKPDYREIPEAIATPFQMLGERIKSFLKTYETNPSAKVPQEFIEQLKEIQAEIEPQVSSGVPDDVNPTLKQLFSKSKWTAYDPETGAAGSYQFTEKQWNDIRSSAPELGLTENGRMAKDQAQQDEAMVWVNEQNTKTLQKSGLPVTVDTLYAAHLLGPDTAVEVLKSKDNIKIKPLVTPEIMKKMDFRNRMTVGEFKDWLLQKTLEAEVEVSDAQTVIDKNGN